MRIPVILSAILLAPSALSAEVPNVAADIAPVHSLVARVMQGVGTPELIIRQGASPHDYALRPSEATALSKADVVVWMGPELTPWLQNAVETLADEARHMDLLEAKGTVLHEFREAVHFEGAEHEEAGHDDVEHDESEHEKEHHDDNHDSDHGHDHDGVDPHAWLDPVNGQVWMRLIAAELSAIDPENAEIYMANAKAGVAELDQVIATIEKSLAPVHGVKFLVYHDAFQYFETRFNMAAMGAVSDGDAVKPGPARLAKLRKLAADENINCLLNEPQTDPRLAEAIFPQGAKIGVMDPLGSDSAPGPELYPTLLLELAESLESCGQ